jgi:hypothetical protein
MILLEPTEPGGIEVAKKYKKELFHGNTCYNF